MYRKGEQKRLSLSHGEKRCTEDDDRGRAVADFFVLGPCELDHRFRGRVADLALTQDRVAVVRQHDAAHRVEQHLQHRARAQACPDNVRHRLFFFLVK